MRIKVADVDEIKPGKCKAVEIDGKKIAVFNSGGNYFAVEDSCSHMGAPLSTGYLSKDSITCEWHGASFDLRTGKATCAPATTDVPVYKVFIEGSQIEIEID